MEEIGCPEAGLAEPEVATATEPAVPSLVDRYFTRWYKAGKCRMMVSSALPHKRDAAGTPAARREPPVPFPELPSARNTGLHCWRTQVGASDVGSAVQRVGCLQERM